MATGRGTGQKAKLTVTPGVNDNVRPRFTAITLKGRPAKIIHEGI